MGKGRGPQRCKDHFLCVKLTWQTISSSQTDPAGEHRLRRGAQPGRRKIIIRRESSDRVQKPSVRSQGCAAGSASGGPPCLRHAADHRPRLPGTRATSTRTRVHELVHTHTRPATCSHPGPGARRLASGAGRCQRPWVPAELGGCKPSRQQSPGDPPPPPLVT